MKIFIKIVIIGLLSAFFTQNCFADDYDFRKIKWGMSKAQVKSSESLVASNESKDILIYKTSILGKKVVLLYNFVNNQLVATAYLVKESHTNKNNHIDDYKEFKKALTKKYGKPITDKVIWYKDLYKSDRSDWGMALIMGHLVYSTSWETENTIIYNTLTGDNYKINYGVTYQSKKLKELKEKAKEKEALDAL